MLNLKNRMIAAITIYMIFMLLLFVFQRKIQYLPRGEIADISRYNLEGFSQKILTTTDSVKILSWYKKPSSSNQKVILYFHGNAGNLGDRAYKLSTFAEEGFGIMAISYRGYSGSEGSSSETGLIGDAQAALNFLYKEGYVANDIILFGESLGSGVAVQLASNNNFSAIILESPFSSIASVAQEIYWFIPVNFLLKDKFESINFVSKILAPILIFHGTKDNVVSYSQGEKLFAAITSKKKFVSVKNAGHLDFSTEFLLGEVKEFLREEGISLRSNNL